VRIEQGGLFLSLEDVYLSVRGDLHVNQAQTLLTLRDWFTGICDFDPWTGLPMPLGLSELSSKVTESAARRCVTIPKDRVGRILDHCSEALTAIVGKPRDKVLREHAMMPIHRAREVDSGCMHWLSRRPGRTVKEKLSGRPYTLAVNRRMSEDTAENRLFKTFLIRLEQLLSSRNDAFPGLCSESDADLLMMIQRWLRTDDVWEIGAWSNLPPNNTLLQDRNYRKIWTGWLAMHALDESTRKDHQRLPQDYLKVLFWNIVAHLGALERVRFVEHPCFFDYDGFRIAPGLELQGRYVCSYQGDRATGRIFKVGPDCNGRLHGTILRGAKRSLYFHSDYLINPTQWVSIHPGTQVTFTESETEHGLSAVDISVTNGGIGIACDGNGNDISVLLELTTSGIAMSLGDRSISVSIKSDKKLLFCVKQNEKNQQIHEFPINCTSLPTITRKTLAHLVDDDPNITSEARSKQVSICDTEVTLDICSTRPRFAGSSGEQILPFRLVRQYWNSDEYGPAVVDCGVTKAISLSQSVSSVSMLSLFSGNAEHSPGSYSDATRSFLHKISSLLKPECLTYLVPDSADDFSLEGIRRGMNFYFPGAVPLPRSIATAFAWQASSSFTNAGVKETDLVLVLDNGPEGASLTPLVSFQCSSLAKRVPESKGIHWERHPTIPLTAEATTSLAQHALEKDGSPFAGSITELLGFDELIDEQDALSFVDDDQKWYNLSGRIKGYLYEGGGQNRLREEEIADAITSIPGRRPNGRVFLLNAGKSLNRPECVSLYTWIEGNLSLTEGGHLLSRWQKLAKEIPFWQDHLPELSIEIPIDGHWDRFYLVKDVTVIPQKGRQVLIPVKNSFTLQAGKKHYTFPLQQGTGGRKLKYQAYLTSPAFPLQKDVICHLKMTYTYGADDPYELVFVPICPTEAEFKSVRTEWREFQPSEVGNPICPQFPRRCGWQDLKSFPKKDGKPNDLLRWIEQELLSVATIAKDGRSKSTIESDWKTDKNGFRYCFAKDGTMLHQDGFEPKLRDWPIYGTNVTFYRFENKGRFKGVDVAIDEAIPAKCFLQKRLRFPALTIWSHSRSLSDPDIPQDFRQAVSKGVIDGLIIMRDNTLPDALKWEICYFLCCLHLDTPENISSWLVNKTAQNLNNIEVLRKCSELIGNAIGDCHADWQRSLLDYVIELIESENDDISSIGLEIMSSAIWRSEHLIESFPYNMMHAITAKLLLNMSRKFNNFFRDDNNRARFVNRYEIVKLELLLALLRTRGFQDPRIKGILAPGQIVTVAFVDLINRLTTKICKENLGSTMRTRINLQIEKPRAFHNTPDLLYALRMYLTGDSGANAIQVSGVTEEE
jgi:hypothetical protein